MLAETDEESVPFELTKGTIAQSYLSDVEKKWFYRLVFLIFKSKQVQSGFCLERVL